MKTISLTQLLLVLLLLPVMWSCKKDKDSLPTNQNPAQPTLRQASLEANITGAQIDSFIISLGDEVNDGGLSASYFTNENKFSIASIRAADSYTLMFSFDAIMPSLEIGVNALTVGENESLGSYFNSNFSTQTFLMTSGNLNITAVDNVPPSVSSLNSKYVSGTFFFTMENDDSGATVEAEGSFTDVLVWVLE